MRIACYGAFIFIALYVLWGQMYEFGRTVVNHGDGANRYRRGSAYGADADSFHPEL
ncbi:hypothetical protein GX48_07890 [Paracoccidioides brasiliensis]|nr:hypothetical protein GX48_07890 [Paracoccidioides brasiliensis]